GMPRIGFAVPERFDDDHLAREAALLQRARGGLYEQRAQQHRPLRMDRRTVSPAELVPDEEVRAGDLVAMIGLCGEEIGVVDLHLVSRLELGQHRWVGPAGGWAAPGGSAPPRTTMSPAICRSATRLPAAAPDRTRRSPPRKPTSGGALVNRNATGRFAASPSSARHALSATPRA